MALLVLFRGVFNAALAAYARREPLLLGKGAMPFWGAVAALNVATFVAMVRFLPNAAGTCVGAGSLSADLA